MTLVITERPNYFWLIVGINSGFRSESADPTQEV